MVHKYSRNNHRCLIQSLKIVHATGIMARIGVDNFAVSRILYNNFFVELIIRRLKSLIGQGECRYFFDGTNADFTKFFKFTSQSPLLWMKELRSTVVPFEIFPEDPHFLLFLKNSHFIREWNKILLKIFSEDTHPLLFPLKFLFTSLPSLKIFWKPMIVLIKISKNTYPPSGCFKVYVPSKMCLHPLLWA